MINQTLLRALRNFSSSNGGCQFPSSNHSLGRFMASIKFRSDVTESSTMKFDVAYICSRIIQQSSIFLNCSKMNEEPVQGATSITEIIGKGYVQLPIDDGSYSHTFYPTILSVALLNDRFEVAFAKLIKNYPAYFFSLNKTFEIMAEYPLRGGPYRLNVSSMARRDYKV